MKTRYTAIAVAALAVPLLTACPPPSPPTFVPRTEYWQGLYPVSTDPTVQFRIEPGLYMSEVDSFPDDVNREDASGNIFAPPVTDRVLIEVESTDISVEVVQGHLVRWAARVPALFPGRYVEGMYLSWTELGPGTYHVLAGGTDGVREWARLKAINVEADTDILDNDFSDDGSPITPLVIDAATPSSAVPVVYLHGVFERAPS